ncbi:MAG: hypothetical protein J6A94_10165 [Lachnospiraceae bacterium]|nr:hypothetical protein [Lachnospiraceae bacterium]
MKQTMKRVKDLEGNRSLYWKLLCSVILVFYPLRHIHWGIDFWDTGYNYANFQYMGFEHMDSMWVFSTYLANVVGNLLSKLPAAGSLVGMNFYTGLFVSGLAVAGFWFCTEKLQIPVWLAFVGEMVAISLCWCPTALLYNYMTYVFFLACVVLLYLGLSRKKKWYLFGAGICLGINVLVRFSNLPEAALIVGVWAYAVIEALEDNGAWQRWHWKEVGWKKVWQSAWKQIWQNTLWCLGGYLAALIVLFGYIQIRYGLDNYVDGILRLFAMTDNATDYKATSMIMGLVGTYVENLYWVIRIGFFVVVGILLFVFGRLCLENKVIRKLRDESKIVSVVCKALEIGLKAGGVIIAVVMLWWLYEKGFCATEYTHYGAILWPGVTFLMLTMGIAVIRIFHPKCPKEEKLISGLLFLVVLLTSLGSNNKVYPSMNNLFVAAPYTLWECWRFLTKVKEWRWKRLVASAFPVKTILTAFLGLFLFQSALFGVKFVFAEGTGILETSAMVENNEILKGVRMQPERAQWMEEATAYVKENNLQGREVLLYGELPALSYYLQMPSAFNPWSDLRSYSLETMEQDMQEMEANMAADEAQRSVIIVEYKYVQFLEGGKAALEKLGLYEQQIQKIAEDEKWVLIRAFMEKYGYEKTYFNEKFSMYE